MIYNKKIVIGIVVVVIIGIGIAITAASMNRKEAKEHMPAYIPTENISDAPLKIENFSSYPDIDASTRTTATESIDHFIADTVHHTDPIGVVRDGSYKKTATGSISNMVFLVDIVSLKRSYKINFGTDSSTGQQTLYILCPENSELIYPSFDCKDDLSEE